MNTAEQTRQQDLERIKLFRYMDDDFMTALKIILKVWN